MPREKLKTDFERWIEEEGFPTFRGYNVPNLNTLKLEPCEKIGGNMMYLLLDGMEDTNAAYVAEIPAGKNLKSERHLYEEVIYVLKGRGATTVWYDENKQSTFEWKEGSLFLIPPNAWHIHFNTQGSEPARLYAVTTAPITIGLFHNYDFVFNNDFQFTDRFNVEDNFYSGEGVALPNRVWDTNYIDDVRNFPLQIWKERGAGGKQIRFELGNNCLVSHVSEFPVGTYKKAHRHGPGANVIIVDGQGYSLLWRDGEVKLKIDWEPGSLLVPPNNVFHQHFNSGAKPARYLAIRWGSRKHPVLSSNNLGVDVSVKQGGNQIEYEDEDLEVRELFERELPKNNVESRMPPIVKV